MAIPSHALLVFLLALSAAEVTLKPYTADKFLERYFGCHQYKRRRRGFQFQPVSSTDAAADAIAFQVCQEGGTCKCDTAVPCSPSADKCFNIIKCKDTNGTACMSPRKCKPKNFKHQEAITLDCQLVAGSEYSMKDTIIHLCPKLRSRHLASVRACFPPRTRFNDVCSVVDPSQPAECSTSRSTGYFSWKMAPTLPAKVSEVGSALAGNWLVVFGSDDYRTFKIDVTRPSLGWHVAARRLYHGDHIATLSIGSTVWAIGGLGSYVGDRVQVLDVDADRWSEKARLPRTLGSAGAVVIHGDIYVCGGMFDSETPGDGACYRYSISNNVWSGGLQRMPRALNHFAYATDGERFWCFGGRPYGNTLHNGDNMVQVYDPRTDTWEDSDRGDLAALPFHLSGTGAAVYLNGQFVLIGGETEDNPEGYANQNRVFEQVHIYDPESDSFSLAPPMPSAKHGISPVLVQTESKQEIWVAGGSTGAGAVIADSVHIMEWHSTARC